MAQIRVSMIIDSRRLPELIALMRPEDAVTVNTLEINRVPAEVPARPVPRRRARRPYNPHPKQSARAFILEYAKQNPGFSVAKDLVPEGVNKGFQRNTLYSTCTRLTKTGGLKRNSVGHYQLVDGAAIKPPAEQ